MRHRRLAVLAIAGLGLVAASNHHPVAELRLVTHDIGDPAPRRMQAAVDLGLVGISVLYTWTVRRIR